MVGTELKGPLRSAVVRLALDTGATGTLINTAILVALGLDPSAAVHRVQVTTGSGVEFAPLVEVDEITALGSLRSHFPVLSHTLPPSASVDGLLGLDFLRGQKLLVDFQEGQLSLTGTA